MDAEKCNPDIYKDGTLVFMTHSIPSNELHKWVQMVAILSEQPVDWHFAGGRACVLALGDLPRVLSAITDLLPIHNKMQEAESSNYIRVNPFTPSYTLYEVGTCNPMHQYAREVVLQKNEAIADMPPEVADILAGVS